MTEMVRLGIETVRLTNYRSRTRLIRMSIPSLRVLRQSNAHCVYGFVNFPMYDDVWRRGSLLQHSY